MKETLSPTEVATESLLLIAYRYRLSPQFQGHGTQRLAEHLREFYDQVSTVGQDWVRLGLWTREEGLGRLATGEIIPITERLRFYYLRPGNDNLDIFSANSDATGNFFLDQGLNNTRVVDATYEFDTGRLLHSQTPLYSIMWGEPPDSQRNIGQSLNTQLLAGSTWSQLPEELRKRMKQELLSVSIKCDHVLDNGAVLTGMTINKTALFIYLKPTNLVCEPGAPSDEAELLLTDSMGSILDILYAQGAESFLGVE